MFGIEVVAALPDAQPELHQACLDHRLPPESGRFRKEIARLARKVAGLPEPSTKRFITDWLGLSGRSRRAAEGNRTA